MSEESPEAEEIIYMYISDPMYAYFYRWGPDCVDKVMLKMRELGNNHPKCTRALKTAIVFPEGEAMDKFELMDRHALNPFEPIQNYKH